MSRLDLTPAQRYHALMFLFLAAAAASIPAIIWLVEHAHLPWYLHIPLAALALTVLPVGAMAAGWAYYHHEREKQKESGQGQG